MNIGTMKDQEKRRWPADWPGEPAHCHADRRSAECHEHQPARASLKRHPPLGRRRRIVRVDRQRHR